MLKSTIISFWKQVKKRSSAMFTLFKVGIGVKLPTHKLHVKDTTDPIKVEGLQNDTTDPDKFLTIDSSNIVKYRTGTQVLSDLGIAADEILDWTADQSATDTIHTNNITDLHGAGVNGSANQLLTDDGDGTVTSESHLTFASSTLELGGDTFDSFKIQRKDHSDNIGGELRIFSGAGGGTNKAGGDLIFKTGKGTGTALGGAIEFYVSTAGSSGDTPHFLQGIDMKITDGLVHVTGNITLTGTVDGIDIATDVAANTAKTSFPGFGTSGGTALEGNTTLPPDLTVNGAGTIHLNNVPTLNQSTTGNATSATVSATSMLADAAAASTTYYPVLVDGLTGAQTLEAESELTFVGNTGILTATGFAGALTGDVTGNADTATNLTTGDKTLGGVYTARGYIVDGNRDIAPSGNGVGLHLDANDYKDSATSASGTASMFNYTTIENCRLLADNASVTTTEANTLYIKGAPVASTNQTITRANALKVAGGNVEFGADLAVGANLTVTGNITGKQYQVFPSNFIDDIGTSVVFIPIHGTTFEQSSAYQDDVAIVAPCDGRVVSVTMSLMSVNASADLTLSVYTLPPNISGTGSPFTDSWVLEETEQISITGSSDSHALNFAFSNAKHFESTEKFIITIQASSDPGPNTYMYATTVVEWDYSTLLSTTAEHSSAP